MKDYLAQRNPSYAFHLRLLRHQHLDDLLEDALDALVDLGLARFLLLRTSTKEE